MFFSFKKNSKMFKRVNHILKFVFKYLVNGTIYFKNPKKNKVIIFDSKYPGSFYLRYLFLKKITHIIPTRAEEIKEIHLTKEVIKYILKNFFKRSLKQNYLIILIKLINPKIVVTYTDNSPDFYLISKLLRNEIRFIAFQQGTRSLRRQPVRYGKEIFIPEFYCLSNWDKNYFEKKKAKVTNFFVEGSLKVALAKKFIKSNKIKIHNNKYDICIIGEHGKIWGSKAEEVLNYNKKNFPSTDKYDTYNFIEKHGFSTGTHAKYVQKLCKKHNLRFIIAGKHLKNTVLRQAEINFYKHYLGNNNFKLVPGLPHKFSNYQLILQSRLIIGCDSTLLRETLALKKKVLHCNLSGHPGADIPIKKDFAFKGHSFEAFEKKVVNILNMSDNNYFKSLGKNKDYIIANSENLEKKINQRLFTSYN